MNTEPRTKANNNFEKDSFKLMINSVFQKTMENVRKYKDIKLVVNERRIGQLVPEPNYRTTKVFKEETGITNKQKRSKYEQASVFKYANYGHQQDSDV